MIMIPKTFKFWLNVQSDLSVFDWQMIIIVNKNPDLSQQYKNHKHNMNNFLFSWPQHCLYLLCSQKCLSIVAILTHEPVKFDLYRSAIIHKKKNSN